MAIETENINDKFHLLDEIQADILEQILNSKNLEELALNKYDIQFILYRLPVDHSVWEKIIQKVQVSSEFLPELLDSDLVYKFFKNYFRYTTEHGKPQIKKNVFKLISTVRFTDSLAFTRFLNVLEQNCETLLGLEPNFFSNLVSAYRIQGMDDSEDENKFDFSGLSADQLKKIIDLVKKENSESEISKSSLSVLNWFLSEKLPPTKNTSENAKDTKTAEELTVEIMGLLDKDLLYNLLDSDEFLNNLKTLKKLNNQKAWEIINQAIDKSNHSSGIFINLFKVVDPNTSDFDIYLNLLSSKDISLDPTQILHAKNIDNYLIKILEFVRYSVAKGSNARENNFTDILTLIYQYKYKKLDRINQEKLQTYVFQYKSRLSPDQARNIIYSTTNSNELDHKLCLALFKDILSKSPEFIEKEGLVLHILLQSLYCHFWDYTISTFKELGLPYTFEDISSILESNWLNNPAEGNWIIQFLNNNMGEIGFNLYIAQDFSKVDSEVNTLENENLVDTKEQNLGLTALKIKIAQYFDMDSHKNPFVYPLLEHYFKIIESYPDDKLFFITNIIEKYGFWSFHTQQILLGKSSRSELKKTGSEIWVYNNGLIRNRILSTTYKTWQEIAKIVPVSPILKVHEKGKYTDVITRYCGKNAYYTLSYLTKNLGNPKYRDQSIFLLKSIWRQIFDIKKKLAESRFVHNHLHVRNFTVEYIKSSDLNLDEAESQSLTDFEHIEFSPEKVLEQNTQMAGNGNSEFLIPKVRVIDFDASATMEVETLDF